RRDPPQPRTPPRLRPGRAGVPGNPGRARPDVGRWRGPLRGAEGMGSAQEPRRGAGGGAGPELRLPVLVRELGPASGAVPVHADVGVLRAAPLAHELLRDLAP